jgi:DNA replication protein DnaC
MGENNIPSKLRSWLYWKEKLDNWEKLKKLTGTNLPSKEFMIKKVCEKENIPFTGICPMCDGWEEIPSENVYCLCKILHWQNEKYLDFSDYQRSLPNVKLSDLDLVDLKHKDKQRKFYAEIKKWIVNPDKWLTISGPLGIGKTHVLNIISKEYHPIALYISAIQFESFVFRTLKEGILEEFVNTVMHAPILLFDDWGADYGTEIGQAKLRMVIDWRYQNPKEYPTIVTTNKTVQSMLSDSFLKTDRIASRIMDVRIAEIIDLEGVRDFRPIRR